jgi:arylsulfatase A-like enzyme
MPSVPSPHLQELADQGIVFDSAFAAAPLCTPARSSMFSGLLPHQNGLMGLTHNGWQYHDDVRTLPQLMTGLGYRSALIGLQHEDLDARVLGFEEVHGLGFLPRAIEVAKRTEEWLEQPGDGRPFFLTVGMWEAHRPWPAEDYEPTDPATVDVPPYLPDNQNTRRDISEFHGSIRQLDEAVGMIMAALDRSPFAQNTLVVFTTDHGAAFPGAKSTLYDSGVGVAMIARPPTSWKTDAHRESAMVSHLDLVPTIVEIAGGIVDAGLEGSSFVDTLKGTNLSDEGRELVLEKTYHDRYDPIRALRTTDAKYIRNFEHGPKLPLPTDLEESWTRRGLADDHLDPRPSEELYLLADDPAELVNLASDPQHSGTKQRLAERLDFHMRRTMDPLLDSRVNAPAIPDRKGKSTAR